MTKLTLFVILLVLAGFLSYWLYRSQHLLTGPAMLSAPVTVTTTTTSSTLPPESRMSGGSGDQPDLTPAEIQSLRLQLEEARFELQTRRENLERLKRERIEQQNQLQLQIPQTAREVHNNAAQIQQLTDALEVQRLAERDVQWAAENAHRSQSQAAEASRAQLEEQIRTLEQAQRETQAQILQAQSQYFDLTLRADRLTLLSNQLALQTQELESLRAQRAGLPATTLSESQSIARTSQLERENLVNTEQELLAQIASLREEIRKVQVAEEESRLNLTRLNDQIGQTQEAIDDQNARIEEMQETLQAP